MHKFIETMSSNGEQERVDIDSTPIVIKDISTDEIDMEKRKGEEGETQAMDGDGESKGSDGVDSNDDVNVKEDERKDFLPVKWESLKAKKRKWVEEVPVRPPRIVDRTTTQRMFLRELAGLMYGFGDVREPLRETAEVIDDVVTEYIANVTSRAAEMNYGRSNRIHESDIIFLVRNDRKKFSRAFELINKDAEIQNARRAFNEDEYSSANKRK